MTVLVPCREASDAEIWTGPRRLAKVATEAGWTVRVTYAKAELEDKNDEFYITESIAVRLHRPPLAAGAIWYDNRFDHGFVWSRFTAPRRIGARDLSRFVKASAA